MSAHVGPQDAKCDIGEMELASMCRGSFGVYLKVTLYKSLNKGSRGGSVQGVGRHVEDVLLPLLHPVQPCQNSASQASTQPHTSQNLHLPKGSLYFNIYVYCIIYICIYVYM